MIQQRLFKQLESELLLLKPLLSKTTDSILDQEISKYPIFIVHQGEMELGLPLIDKEKHQSKWSINISTLEEFTTKQLVNADKIDTFRNVFKDPETHFCLFVLNEAGANFVFLPRQDLSHAN